MIETVYQLQEENEKLRRQVKMLDEENRELIIENAQLLERIKRLEEQLYD
jgi:regulator of replication initiation timing